MTAAASAAAAPPEIPVVPTRRVLGVDLAAVSYTHLTLPTNREV